MLVKLLHLESGDTAIRERFRSEATAVARLSHPGIVAVYDTLLEAGATGLVLEHVEAIPLSRFLHDGGPVSAGEALSIALQVADALAVAHGQGVRHCNLSPDSVWLCGDQRIKITDFGTAWAHGGGSGDPPDDARAQEQADIGALAGVLRDCLAPGGANAELPEDLAGFIAEAGPHRTGGRFDSVAEARTFLAAVRGVHPPPELPQIDFPPGPAQPPPADHRPVPEPVAPRRVPRARAITLIAAAVAAAVVVPALIGDDPPASEPPPLEPPVVTTEAPEATATAEPPSPGATVAGDAGERENGRPDEGENGGGSGGETPAPAAADVVPAADAGVAIVDVVTVTFGPRTAAGDHPDALRTLDGDPSTHWATPGLSAGDSTLGGVGLEFQLAEPTAVWQLAITSDTVGWEGAVFVGTGGHDHLSDWGLLVDQQINVTGHVVFGLADQRASAVLLWIPDPRAALTDEIRIAEAIISAAPDPAVR